MCCSIAKRRGRILSLHPKMTQLSVSAMGLKTDGFYRSFSTGIEFGLYLWAYICGKYKSLRKEGYNINAVKYEDLVQYRAKATEVILRYADLPTNLAEVAATALDIDSQRDSPLR